MAECEGDSLNSKNYFDRVASEWDQMRKNFFSEKVREKAYEVAGLTKNKTAADIGAGTGFITEGLLKAGLKVIAVDQSEEMLKKIKTKFLPSYSDLDCRCGSAESLPVCDNQVDYVFANMFLHHVNDPLIAVKEMVRILKPGGVLVITDLDKHNFEFLRIEQHDRWLGFDRKYIKDIFNKAGLKNVKIECVGADCCSESNCESNRARISIFAAYGSKT